jgi:hypothetical protein
VILTQAPYRIKPIKLTNAELQQWVLEVVTNPEQVVNWTEVCDKLAYLAPADPFLPYLNQDHQFYRYYLRLRATNVS